MLIAPIFQADGIAADVDGGTTFFFTTNPNNDLLRHVHE